MARILVVDEEQFVRREIARYLEEYGHEIYQLSSGYETLEVCKSIQFDLALIDYNLSEQNGLQVFQELRTILPSCLRILITGMLNLPEAIQAVKKGEITRIIEKPFQKERLISVINMAIELRQRMQEVAIIQHEASKNEELKFLDECLNKDLLHLSLQPMIEVTNNTTLGFEALLYSEHSILNTTHSLLSTVEKYKRFSEITSIAFGKAKEILESVPGEFKLFLNIHPDELEDMDLFLSILEQIKPWANRVVLEISGRRRLQSILQLEERVQIIHNLGFGLAVDDIGAGYDSLSVLADLNPNFIKVDITTVRGIYNDPQKQRFVQLLCRLASAIGAHVVAEGVERFEDFERLKECGDIIVQGYLFAHPSRDADSFLEVLKKDWTLLDTDI